MRALVVVDYQYDFVNGTLRSKDAELLDEGIANKIREYHKNGDVIICTFDTHDKHYLRTQEGRNLPIMHCIKGTPGWKLFGETAKAAYECGALAVEKGTFGSMQGIPNLFTMFAGKNGRVEGTMNKVNEDGESYLDVNEGFEMCIEYSKHPNPVTEVEICGLITNVCVIANAIIIKSIDPEIRVKVLASLCGSNDKRLQEQAFNVMKSLQMDIVR